MILLFVVCLIHQISATNYVFQGSTDQVVKRYIYSSDCFENYGSREVEGKRVGSIVARLDKAVGSIKPYCPELTFELPTKSQLGKSARITIKQYLPGDAASIMLVTNASVGKVPKAFFLGCLFSGTEKDGSYFGTSTEYSHQRTVVNAVSMLPPVSCSFEIAMEYFKKSIENAHQDWILIVDTFHPPGYDPSTSNLNLHDILFSKYPQESLPIKKYNAKFGDDCVESNENCFYAPECVKNDEYEPDCPAKFVVQYNGDHIRIKLESSRSGVKGLRFALQKHKPNEDLGLVDHSRRLLQFECFFDGEKSYQKYHNISIAVSNIEISRTKTVCSFKIDLGNGQKLKDIFDNTDWEMSFDSESYYQFIHPEEINWKG